jgi:hypothetical protein
MIAKIIDWFFAPSEKLIVETDDVYDKLLELEARIEVLEEENVELTNELYRMENSLDARIDILTLEKWNKKDV